MKWADPLTLTRLFGITEKNAMRYVGVARPKRPAKLPQGHSRICRAVGKLDVRPTTDAALASALVNSLEPM
ncbi:hypothetical protein ACF1BE_32200 [Streptomyces sp. NPDC014991]|uniref:hypothetical protein n=1 Tax=Streptomyces sp. NPDC014991 TaxID=3364935 RepID=UPI0036FDC886